jgi:hypothetical protein
MYNHTTVSNTVSFPRWAEKVKKSYAMMPIERSDDLKQGPKENGKTCSGGTDDAASHMEAMMQLPACF